MLEKVILLMIVEQLIDQVFSGSITDDFEEDFDQSSLLPLVYRCAEDYHISKPRLSIAVYGLRYKITWAVDMTKDQWEVSYAHMSSVRNVLTQEIVHPDNA